MSWSPVVIGDRRCEQKSSADGRRVNHGRFVQIHQTTKKMALEGQFSEGKKQGIWAYYLENGDLAQLKYFESGVEKVPPPNEQKKMDLILLQKTGKR